MALHSVFDSNCVRLRRRNPVVAEEVAAADDEQAEIGVGPQGQPTLSWRGVRLASAYSPGREAEQVAASALPEGEGADLAVVAGLGLGHLSEHIRQSWGCPLYIYEPDPGRLRAALRARDMSALLDDPQVEVFTDLAQLLLKLDRGYTPGLRLRVVLLPALRELEPQALSDLVQRIGRAKNAIDTAAVTRVRCTDSWTEYTLQNTNAIVSSPSLSCLFDQFENQPAVIVAAGPSLDRQLETLAEFQGRVVVIAIGQVAAALCKAGIRADFVHVIESQTVAHQLEQDASGEDLIVALDPSVHPSVFDVPARARFIATPLSNPVAGWLAQMRGDDRLLLGGGTVAQSAVAVAAALGCNPILLIGQDLAYSDGRAYARGSVYDAVGVRVGADASYVLTNTRAKGDLFDDRAESDDEPAAQGVFVEGWDGKPVATSVTYASFIDHYRELGLILEHSGIRLVNCTEGGARIHGLEHAAFADTLSKCAKAPIDARARILAAHDEWLPAEAAIFEAPLAKAERNLAALARQVRAAQRVLARALRCKGGAGDRALLERVKRAERRTWDCFARVEWVEALVQEEVYEALAATRRAGFEGSEVERALTESRLILRAAARGTERGRELCKRLAPALLEPAQLKRGGRGAEGPRERTVPPTLWPTLKKTT